MFALRVKQTVDKGWLHASKEQKNIYYTDYFTKGIKGNRKLLRYASQLVVEHMSTKEQPSLDFDTLVEKCELRDFSMKLKEPKFPQLKSNNDDDDEINYIQK